MNGKIKPSNKYIENILTCGLENEADKRRKPKLAQLDLKKIMGLRGDEFIEALYYEALERTPDPEGLRYCRELLASGAKNEALAYIVCTSQEFANRKTVLNIEQYKNAYLRYNRKKRIKSNPYFRWIWDFMKIPRRVREQRIIVEQLLSILQQNQKEQIEANNEISNFKKALLDINQEVNRKIAAVEAKVDKLTEQQNSIGDQMLRLQTINSEKSDDIAKMMIDLSVKNKTAFAAVPGGVIAILVSDFIMGIPSEEWRFAMFLSLYGHFEPGTEKFFGSLIEKDMTFIDVGANLGIYSLIAGRAGSTVYAYEPTPNIFRILKENIAANGFEVKGNIHPYNLAVADTEKRILFSVYKGLSGHNNMFDDTADRIEVEAVSLDHHITAEKIDIVKIDVEGAEYFVLKGMAEIISRNTDIKIILEFAPTHISKAGISPIEFIRFIKQLGFDIALIDGETGVLSRIENEKLISVYSENLFLARSHIMQKYL